MKRILATLAPPSALAISTLGFGVVVGPAGAVAAHVVTRATPGTAQSPR
ncbi:MAG TPA: hypothetical protein VNF05_07900 [Acidimicrobiales bacterium]|nr:hypothetical protein [Acidimicrobiales bacterium]